MSSTGGDAWQVKGTNTAGSASGTILASSGADDGTFVALPTAGSYNYLDFFAKLGPQSGEDSNVLLQQLSYATPEPGMTGLMGAGLAAVAALMRRRKRNHDDSSSGI